MFSTAGGRDLHRRGVPAGQPTYDIIPYPVPVPGTIVYSSNLYMQHFNFMLTSSGHQHAQACPTAAQQQRVFYTLGLYTRQHCS